MNSSNELCRIKDMYKKSPKQAVKMMEPLKIESNNCQYDFQGWCSMYSVQHDMYMQCMQRMNSWKFFSNTDDINIWIYFLQYVGWRGEGSKIEKKKSITLIIPIACLFTVDCCRYSKVAIFLPKRLFYIKVDETWSCFAVVKIACIELSITCALSLTHSIPALFKTKN